MEDSKNIDCSKCNVQVLGKRNLATLKLCGDVGGGRQGGGE